MKMKKVLSMGLIAVMTLGLTACGGGDKQAEEDSADDAGEKTVLKVAAAETAYGQDLWKDVCAGFEALNPDVTVELTIDKNIGASILAWTEKVEQTIIIK